MVKFINITNEINDYQDNILEFLNKLSTERRFLDIDLYRILKSRLIFVAIDDTINLSEPKVSEKRPLSIVGVAGIEKNLELQETIRLLVRVIRG